MLTIAETPLFKAEADVIWSEAERNEFFTWLANNPEAGDVIAGSGGCRKLRWARSGMGKRGGARVIYFTQLSEGIIWLLMLYVKAERGSIPAHLLKAIKQSIQQPNND